MTKYFNLLFKTFFSLVVIPGISVMNLSAQEMWGYANSNYSGIMGLHVNPAKVVGTPYEFEVNVLGADIFYDNNYLYLPKLSAVNTKTTSTEDGTKSNPTTFVEYTSPGSKHAFVNALVLGPGFIKNKLNHAWAVHSAVRVVASANGVPSALTQGFSSGFDYAPLHNKVFRDMKLNAAGMAFAEVGFTYGKVYINRELHWLAWGATLNGIIAFDGMYLHAEAGEYSIPDSSSLYMNHVNLDYGHAFGLGQSPRGYGGSADLGLVYIHKRVSGGYECGKNADNKKRYQYKVGLSLIDMGYVNFSSEAARIRINDGSLQWSYLDTAKFKSVDDFDRQLSAHSSGDEGANQFGMITPAAASLQLDYCLEPRWYASLSFMQRIPLSNREVYRANSISFTPRYERSKFEASLSANMYEYEHVYLGAALRYSFFVIGTDRLSSFFGSDVRSMDVFFGFKFNSCMLQKKVSNKGKCPING
ncbi:MAG: DUF5723 family protein [Bacteroidota bacterium]